MKEVIIVPDGWMCMIEECPPGFFMYEGQLCFKSEYGMSDIFCSSGEYFMPRNIMVQPTKYEVRDA
jgi:hypothetical protein